MTAKQAVILLRDRSWRRTEYEKLIINSKQELRSAKINTQKMRVNTTNNEIL
jgi:hypothetical protein